MQNVKWRYPAYAVYLFISGKQQVVMSLRVGTHDLIWVVGQKLSVKNPHADYEAIFWEAGHLWNTEEYSGSDR